MRMKIQISKLLECDELVYHLDKETEAKSIRETSSIQDLRRPEGGESPPNRHNNSDRQQEHIQSAPSS